MIKINPNIDVYGPNISLWARGQEGGVTRPINIDVLFRNTIEVCGVFDTLDIDWCLSHGTVLGVYRDGNCIAWDDDSDIAIFAEDRPKLAEARRILREKGYYVPDEGDPSKPIDPKSNMPYYDFVAIKDGEKCEGWIFDKHEKFYVYDPKREGLAIPRKFMDSFDKYKWRDTEVNIPAHIEEYLVHMYGSGWNQPDPNKKYNANRES